MAGSVSPGFWKTQSLWNAKVTRVARGGFGAKAPRLTARPMLIYFAILIYCASRSPRPRCLARLGLDRHGVAVREWHSKTWGLPCVRLATASSRQGSEPLLRNTWALSVGPCVNVVVEKNSSISRIVSWFLPDPQWLYKKLYIRATKFCWCGEVFWYKILSFRPSFSSNDHEQYNNLYDSRYTPCIQISSGKTNSSLETQNFVYKEFFFRKDCSKSQINNHGMCWGRWGVGEQRTSAQRNEVISKRKCRSYPDFFPASCLRFGWVTSHLSLFSVTNNVTRNICHISGKNVTFSHTKIFF